MSVATSAVDICNLAISMVQKENRITSLLEDSVEAKLCNRLFYNTLDTLLEEHPWNFAIERATLGRSTSAPEFGYDYKFQLPTDPYCLRVLKVYNGDAYEETDYQIEGRYLLTDAEEIKIKYIARITYYSKLSSNFRMAFVYLLASQLAEPLANSTALATDMANKFNRFFNKAKRADAKQHKAFSEDDTKFNWDTARYLG